MKKLFTIDDFMVAFISAMGYGFGYTLAKRAGCSEIISLAACVALGMGLEVVISKLIFNKAMELLRNIGHWVILTIWNPLMR